MELDVTNQKLQIAVSALKTGNKTDAKNILISLVRENPRNAPAWYGLSLTLDEPSQKLDCIRTVLNINPDFPGAKQQLMKLSTMTSPDMERPVAQKFPAITNLDLKDKSIPGSTHPEVKLNQKGLDAATIQNLRAKHIAGKSAMEMAKERKKKMWRIAGPFLILMLICVPVGWVFDFWTSLIIVVALFIVYRIMIIFIDRMQLSIGYAVKGAKAEEKIASLLVELGKDFRVLHDVQSQYGNIDHVIVSKSGAVFVIETKGHNGHVKVENGKILVNGKPPEKDFILQTLRNVYWLRDKVKIVTGSETFVVGMVVFTNAFVEYSRPVKGIHVLNKKFMLATIRKQAYRKVVDVNIRDKVVDLLLEIA